MASMVWKDGTRRGIAYVEGKETADRLLEITGRKPEAAPRSRRARAAIPAADIPLEGAMAVYLDRRGKPFAWQIPFDIAMWDRVATLIAPQ